MPNPGKTYAEILGAMRCVVIPEDSSTVVWHIREMATGGVLLELAMCDDRAKLPEPIKKAVGENGDIHCIVPRLKLEILDLDTLSKEDDVTEALQKYYQPSLVSLRSSSSRLISGTEKTRN